MKQAFLFSLLIAGLCQAQTTGPSILDRVGIDQNLNAQVPLDLIFRDETGREVKLGDYFTGKRPLILTLVYFRCPMLCTMVLNDLSRSMNALKSMSAGDDFEVLSVSFDPRETPEMAASKKVGYIRAYRRPHAEEGWHFLTGSEDSIRKLTETVGFRYAYDPKFDQYAHASGFVILTPDGRVSRYFYGVDYSVKDLRLSLTEASGGKIGSPVEKILLYCFHYDVTTGQYSLAVTRILKAAAALTVLALASYLLLNFRRERHGYEL